MIFKLTPISTAIFIAFFVNVFVTYSSWKRRKTKGGVYFAFAMIAITFWTLSAALDYSAVPIPLKVFFAKLEYLGYMSAVALFAAFTLSYAGYEDSLKKTWVSILLIGIPVSNILLAWTNELHRWVWTDFRVNESADNVLIFEHGPAFTWIALSGYVLIFIIFVSLLRASLKGTELARKQARLLLLALLALVASNLIYLSDLFNIPGVDWSSITFSITGALFLFALYGSRFMDVVPVARNIMIERMVDGVLVLDAQGHLVDFNPAAQAIFGIRQDDLWMPFQSALARWPEIVAFLENPARPEATEITIGNPVKIFDLRLTSLKDNRNQVYGLLVAMREITLRRQAEEAQQQLSRRNQAILDTAGEGIYGVDKNGNVTFVNPAAAKMLGWSVEELIGEQSHELMHHSRPDGSPYPLEECPIRSIPQDGLIQGEDFFWRKNGTGFPIEFTNNPVVENGDVTGSVVTFRDISERKISEAIIQLRLRLWEFSTLHPVEELMQKALDEIGEITGSPIGFYHFVEEDQNTLSLRAWSTSTLAKFCKAEGNGLHYPINEAGVWVDCVHEKKPVIHNDYASLSHRKGMPMGHATIVRELVVPTLRDGRVVSILGVGNKSFDYDERDVDLVSYIADIIWTIIKQKQAEDALQKANVQLKNQLNEIGELQVALREQANRDSLTKLYNRRFLVDALEREFLLAQRYSQPLSIVLIDIDHFKSINDTYGHSAGDECLVTLAQLMERHFRKSDIICRYGGEEFLIVLPDSNTDLSTQRIEEFRQFVANTTIQYGMQEMRLTISSGIATFQVHGENSNEIIRKADHALYLSKQTGRNRVTAWSDDISANYPGF